MSAIAAVVFDWAGTMIDFGCLAPVRALAAAFAAEDVAITEAQARTHMGVAKRDHVAGLMGLEDVRKAWRSVHGRLPTPADGDRLYAALEPLMTTAAGECSELIPGAAAVAAELARRGIGIGSGTGYTRAMMAPILAAAARQGYAPQVVVCAGETPSGRPSPLMLWSALIALDAWPAWRCVKVDDAASGIAEGRAGGAWSVGVAASGNGIGLSLADFEALDAAERARRRGEVAAGLAGAGADYVIATVADLPPVRAAIEERLAAGERPGSQPTAL
jgi:phosphonoacetaldehyde hydrolase